MKKLLTRRFARLWVLPNLVYAAIALVTDATLLITVLNGAVFALGIGVCVAYFPIVHKVMSSPDEYDEGDWLCLGIFCSWLSVVVARALSMAWRLLGDDGDWIMQSDLVTYTQFLTLSAAVFHLGAPHAIGRRRVPTDKWVSIGIGAAISAFLTLALAWLSENILRG